MGGGRVWAFGWLLGLGVGWWQVQVGDVGLFAVGERADLLHQCFDLLPVLVS